MARKRRIWEDDDGRTVADMSGVDRPHLLLPRRSDGAPAPEKPQRPPEQEERPWEERSMGREERRMYVLGALKAAVLIALAFIAGLGLLIALLLLLWKK